MPNEQGRQWVLQADVRGAITVIMSKIEAKENTDRAAFHVGIMEWTKVCVDLLN